MKRSTFVAMLVIVMCIVVGMLSSCKSKSGAYSKDRMEQNASWVAYQEVARPRAEADSLSRLAQLDTAKWNEFIECTNLPGNGGDAGCDSCFTAIYGFSLEFK